MAIVTITAGATGRDYPTLLDALTSLPGDAIEADNSYVIELYNDAVFSESVYWSGMTTDADHTLTVRAAAGHSWRDSAGAGSGPLTMSQANGVLIDGGSEAQTIDLYTEYLVVDGLQIKNVENSYGIAAHFVANPSVTVTNCLIGGGASQGLLAENPDVTGDVTIRNCVVIGGYHGIRAAAATAAVIENCVVIGATTTGIISSGAGTTAIRNSTVVIPSNVSVGTDGITVYGALAGSKLVVNCAVFGYSVPFKNIFTSGTSSSYINTASGHNATNGASAAPFAGTGSLTSLTYASQFVQPSNAGGVADFRLKTGSSLINAGATLTTASDLFGVTRPQGAAWDIGAREYVTSGGGGAAADLTKTLGTAILTATASAPRTAALTKTLGAAILAATATAPRTAALTKTLGAATLASSGGTLCSADLTKTLGTASMTASAAVLVTANVSGALDPVSLIAIADAISSATLAATLGVTTVTAAGSAAIVVNMNAALGAATLASIVAIAVDATLTVNVNAATIVATTGVIDSAVLELTLDSASVIATAGATSGAALIATLDAATATATTGNAIKAAVSATLGAAAMTATAATSIAANVNALCASATLTASGFVGIAANAALALDAVGLLASGGDAHVNGDLARTFNAAVLTSNGGATTGAALTKTLSLVTASGAGSVRGGVYGTIVLTGARLVATAGVAVAANGSMTLGAAMSYGLRSDAGGALRILRRPFIEKILRKQP